MTCSSTSWSWSIASRTTTRPFFAARFLQCSYIMTSHGRFKMKNEICRTWSLNVDLEFVLERADKRAFPSTEHWPSLPMFEVFGAEPTIGIMNPIAKKPSGPTNGAPPQMRVVQQLQPQYVSLGSLLAMTMMYVCIYIIIHITII